MSRHGLFIYVAILLPLVFSSPCQGECRWGTEVSPNLINFGLLRSFSSKNELYIKVEYDWTKRYKWDEEKVHQVEYPDTTYEHEYKYDQDRSYGVLTLESGIRRYFRSGRVFSPCVGIAVRAKSGSHKNSHNRYQDDTLEYTYDYSNSWYDLGLILSAGLRYIINEHFALIIQSSVASYTYSKSYYNSQSHYMNIDYERIYTDETSRSYHYLRFELHPRLYIQYYF